MPLEICKLSQCQSQRYESITSKASAIGNVTSDSVIICRLASLAYDTYHFSLICGEGGETNTACKAKEG